MNRIYILLLCSVLAWPLMAQQNTSSPYSRYAYGLLQENTPTAYKAMGGVGVGMRSNRAINPSQPASYTACDTLTFMFDAAARIGWSMLQDAGGRKNKGEGSLEVVSMQFPLYKQYLAFSAGIIPYSSCGYNMTIRDTIQGSPYRFTKDYYGEGGVSQVYAGLGGNLFNWVALGVNIYYMFGEVTNTRALTFDSATVTSMTRVTDLEINTIRLRYGLQLFHTFGKHNVVLGGIFEHPMNARGTFIELSEAYEDTIEVINKGLKMPMIMAVGLSYTWNDNLTIAFDYERQYWAQTGFLRQSGSYALPLRNTNRFAFGAQYRHNHMGKNYAERMYWRVGCSLTDSYVADLPVQTLKISAGMGFPLRTAGTMFNLTLEYLRRAKKGFVQEDCLQLTFNAAIRETWFFKRKIN